MIVRGSGFENNNDDDVKSDKKKSTAIILCLFFGILGVHRFYVGKIKSGGLLVLLALVSGGTLGLIWVVYDLFTLIFTNKFTDEYGLPLR